MDGTELTILVALALFAAFVAGGLCGVLVARIALRRPVAPPPAEGPEARARAAEDARNRAVRELEEVRTRFSRQVAAKDAELAATMEALGQARREAADLRRAEGGDGS